MNDYRYHSKYDQKRSEGSSCRYKYHCAQNEKRQQDARKKAGAKPRDRLPMDSFTCKGWLHIVATDSSSVLDITLKHHNDHPPYFPIDVPADIIAFVKKNHELTLDKVRFLLRSWLVAQRT